MSLISYKRQQQLIEEHNRIERDLQNTVAQVGALARRVSHATLYLAARAAVGNANGEQEYLADMRPALDAQRELLRGYLAELDALKGLSDSDPAVVAETLIAQTTATGFDEATYLGQL